MQDDTSIAILSQFLTLPVSDSDAVFQLFRQLPGAVFHQGHRPMERFVYIPGSRPDALLLAAHADTVWDSAYGNPGSNETILAEGVFSGTNPDCGIGADDRAGCAMLWALRKSGHSLLLLNGEERGKIGARYLRKCHPLLFRKLNRHPFILEFDCPGNNSCLFNQVENTPAFREYILSRLNLRELQNTGGCDLQILCHRVCGANIGVGYHHPHRPNETLVVSQWENMLEKIRLFLDQSHPAFPIPPRSRIRVRLRFLREKLGRVRARLKKYFCH